MYQRGRIAMDIPRSDNRRLQQFRKLRWPVVTSVGVVCAAAAVLMSSPTLPEVDRRAIVLGTVSQGEMLRQVRGPGNLVSRDVRWLTARTPGRVDRVFIHPLVRG